MSQFSSRCGPWAVVAGASEGLGVEFAKHLAARGVNLLLIARPQRLLESVAGDLRQHHGIKVRCLVHDLGASGLARALQEAVTDFEVGTLVYNAACVPTGRFLDEDPESLEALVRVNVQGPVTAIRTLAPAMCERGRGGIVLMSSLAGYAGRGADCRLCGQQGCHAP